ncbi:MULTISPECIES: pyridine nucleotide-disulfide oxidoreductase [unclassified Stygiolobus]|jgi:NADH dehydrogenase, FAD-containing subunit|uniref:pyridine nucleotide-disulfide oxidoreductase n=1 Tax=unclassified Stygiolobus TaxID=2824672 RepID=UPI00307F06FE
MMKTTIVGAGYAGLNTYYTLGREAEIISDRDYFIFYTAYLRNLLNLEKNRYTSNLRFVRKTTIKDFDLKGKWIKTKEGTEINAENLVLAVGCDRNEQINFIRKLLEKEKISLSIENEEEYLAIQLAFYLRKIGKDVSYCGNMLSSLGEKVSNAIIESMNNKKIKIMENCEDILPPCKPPHPFEFFPVNEFLQYKGVYIIGDLIKGFPKVGELAMRTGIYVGKRIRKNLNLPFKPVFINIIDTGDYAIHIRSDKLWGGNYESVKKSRLRAFMKRFIEKYYVYRKGKMGILYYL